MGKQTIEQGYRHLGVDEGYRKCYIGCILIGCIDDALVSCVGRVYDNRVHLKRVLCRQGVLWTSVPSPPNATAR